MKRPIFLLFMFIATPALADGMLTPLGPIAADQRAHLIRVTVLTMIAVLPVLVGVPLILWRYRRGRRAKYSPDFDYSAPLEAAMWGVPALIVATLGYWLWQSTLSLDPYKPLGKDPLRVEVIGLDWKWLFLYPDEGVASIGTLAIPAGRPVSLSLTTDTVMQSFMVPSLAGQIYAMPGMVTHLNFLASRPGTATGANTQFNGAGFSTQTVTVDALTENAWQAWIDNARAGPELTASSYTKLAARGTQADVQKALGIGDGPLRLRLDDRTLFNEVVQRYHDGKALPAARQPGAPAYGAEAVK
jgi:cytochrome o ubiquinol oxidase subunit 2